MHKRVSITEKLILYVEARKTTPEGHWCIKFSVYVGGGLFQSIY